jgi:hypothetical protein
MRATILFAMALGLAACGNNGQADNNMNVDENLTAENIVSNDVTAIDAVTGDAANMAADVDTNFGNLDLNAAEATTNAPAAKPARPAPRPIPRSASPATPSNNVENSATNAE